MADAQEAVASPRGGGGLRLKAWMKINFSSTCTGSNMPQGMLTGVPAGGSTSGIGGWGHGHGVI